MKSRVADESPNPEAEPIGLPGLHTWRGVYLFVLGSFILWVGLLVALTLVYS